MRARPGETLLSSNIPPAIGRMNHENNYSPEAIFWGHPERSRIALFRAISAQSRGPRLAVVRQTSRDNVYVCRPQKVPPGSCQVWAARPRNRHPSELWTFSLGGNRGPFKKGYF